MAATRKPGRDDGTARLGGRRWLVLLMALGLSACGGGGDGGSAVVAAAPGPVASAATGALTAAIPPSNPLPANPVVALTSSPGDYIGAGGVYAYDGGSAVISVVANGPLLQVAVQGDQGWTGSFLLPGSPSVWTPGTYTGLVRHPFQPPGGGAISWSGEGRGCNALTGSIEVRSVRYDAGALTAIDMSFEQRCDGADAALRGTVNWDALTPVAQLGPVTPPPATLWSPPAEVKATSGKAMYIASAEGDYVGQGWTYWVGAAAAAAGGGGSSSGGTATVSLTESAGLLRIGVAGEVTWDGEFRTPDSMTSLRPGYYGVLQRYPFHNPTRGGLSWAMNSRGCNRLIGWYVVDQVSYEAGRLQSLELRFEQFCDGSTAPLRGWIRWNLSNNAG